MPEMPKGLLTRIIAILAGIIVIAITVSIVDLSSDGEGLLVLLYVFAAAVYLAHFLVEHEDEIPPRSDRR